MVWIFLIIFFVQVIAEKRILLNDPALVQSQIHELERKMEDVVAKNSDLTVKYNDVVAKYNDLSTKYTEQSAKYTELSTKYTDLSAKLKTLMTKSNGLFTSLLTICFYLRLDRMHFKKKEIDDLYIYCLVILHYSLQ